MAVEAGAKEDEDQRTSDPIDWTPENEIHLFNALKNRRPVGLNRNFQMLFINESFNNLISREVPSSVLWEHLSELYDMETLNDNDSPASSVVDERDFALPSDFDDLLEKKMSSSPVEAASGVTQKATSLLKPASSVTPKQAKGKGDAVRGRESRSVKEEEGKSEDASAKSVKKKVRSTTETPRGAAGTAAKKRRL